MLTNVYEYWMSHALRAIFLIIFDWLDVVIKQLVFLSTLRWKSAWRGKPCKVCRNSIEEKSHRFFVFFIIYFFGLRFSLPISRLLCWHYAFQFHLNNVKFTRRSKLCIGVRASKDEMECSVVVMLTLGWYYVAGRIVCKVNFLCQHERERQDSIISINLSYFVCFFFLFYVYYIRGCEVGGRGQPGIDPNLAVGAQLLYIAVRSQTDRLHRHLYFSSQWLSFPRGDELEQLAGKLVLLFRHPTNNILRFLWRHPLSIAAIGAECNRVGSVRSWVHTAVPLDLEIVLLFILHGFWWSKSD